MEMRPQGRNRCSGLWQSGSSGLTPLSGQKANCRIDPAEPGHSADKACKDHKYVEVRDPYGLKRKSESQDTKP